MLQNQQPCMSCYQNETTVIPYGQNTHKNMKEIFKIKRKTIV